MSYAKVEDPSIIEQLNKQSSQKVTDPDILRQLDASSQQNNPEEEGFLSKLPRNIAAGLLGLGHRGINAPYNTAKEVQSLSKPISNVIEQKLPINQYFDKNKSGYFQGLVDQFNKEHNVPEHLKNPNWGANVENIPHLKDRNYAKMLGQKGEGTSMDWLIQKGIEHSPELASIPFLLKHMANMGGKIFPKAAEKFENIKNYGDLKQKLIEEEKKSLQLGEQAQESKYLSEEAKEEAKKLKEAPEIANYLNVGATHNARAAQAVKHRFTNIENYWSDSYKNLKNNLKDSNFQMERLPEYSKDMEKVEFDMKTLSEKRIPQVSQEVKSLIDKAPKTSDTKASDFLEKYKDFRDARYDLLQRSKDFKATNAERKAAYEAYQDSKPIEQAVSKALNEGLGPHQSEFARINEGYSTQIYPLRGNKVIKQAQKGKLGPNIIEDLAGHGEGQELLRNMVKEDPELLRNIVGQRYASDPSKIHVLDENTAEYLAEMPELQQIMNENLKSIESKLNEVNKHKESRAISLKEKVESENKAKELQDKIKIIKKDLSKILKVGIGLATPVVGKKIISTLYR